MSKIYIYIYVSTINATIYNNTTQLWDISDVTKWQQKSMTDGRWNGICLF